MAIQRTFDPRSSGVASGAALQAGRNLDSYLRQYSTSMQNAMAAPAQSSGGDNRSSMYDLATGRLEELRGDPVDQLLLEQLRGRVTGQDVPYNDETTGAMLTERGQQASAVQSNAVNALLRRGMNPSDPGFAAALAELEAGRQGSMQDARLNIAQRANLANYDARSGATQQLAGFNLARNNAITNQSNYLSNLYGNEMIEETRASSGPTFVDYQNLARQLGLSGGTAPAGNTPPRTAPPPPPPPQPVRQPPPSQAPMRAAPGSSVYVDGSRQAPPLQQSNGQITYRGQTYQVPQNRPAAQPTVTFRGQTTPVNVAPSSSVTPAIDLNSPSRRVGYTRTF